MRKWVDRVIAIHKAPTHHVIYGHGAEIIGGLFGLAGYEFLANVSIIGGGLLMVYAVLNNLDA